VELGDAGPSGLLDRDERVAGTSAIGCEQLLGATGLHDHRCDRVADGIVHLHR
jgi:hypothetical protein